MKTEVEFFPMSKLPERAFDTQGATLDFSVDVLVFDKDTVGYAEIGFYDFEEEKWSYYGNNEMNLACWCYVPNPKIFTENVK